MVRVVRVVARTGCCSELGEYVMPMAVNAGELSGVCEWETGAALEELGVGKRACSEPESPKNFAFLS